MQSSTVSHPVTAPDAQKFREARLEDPNRAEHLSPATRALWGVVSIVPAISLGSFMVAALAGAASSAVVAMGMFTLFWTALAVGIFANRLFKMNMNPERRLTWGMALVALAPLSLPAFWSRHIWSAPKSATTHD